MTRRLVPLPKFRWPIVLLLLGLGLVGAALFETQSTARRNRELARQTIAGYGGFAAWSYQQHLAESLRNAVREVLGPVNHGDQLHTGHNIPGADVLVHYFKWDFSCACHHPVFGPNPSAIFGFTLGSDTLGVAINQLPTPERGWLVDKPQPPAVPVRVLPYDEKTRRWIVDTISMLARGARSPWGYSVIVAADGERSRLFAYTLMPRSAGDTIIYGVEYSAAATDSLFSAVLDNKGLLPAALMEPRPNRPTRTNRDVMGLVLRAPDGRELFQWAADTPHPWKIDAVLPESYGGIHVDAFIRPELANETVIGGLPASRLPFLLGLLALASALTVVAVVQLRREAQFAELRADFVANVSHELRTPLTQIRLVLDTLRLGRERDPNERAKAMALADREVTRLQHLVESVLRFSRAPHAANAPIASPVDLVAETTAIVDDFAPLAAARGASIVVSSNGTSNSAPRVALRDGALRQILINLLDNALKYGPDGQRVQVRIATRGSDQVRLSVSDEGPGISANEMDRIWRPFERGVAATAGAVGGSGIGLTVVRELVEAHGGVVTAQVTSANARGATFDVDFPLVPG